MKKHSILFLLLLSVSVLTVTAQKKKVILHFKDMTTLEQFTDQLDSITFVELTLAILSETQVDNIQNNSAQATASIIQTGNASILEKGFVWGTTPTPTLEANSGKLNDSGATEAFTANLEGLQANTTYYVRAFAVNSIGVAYGTARNFTTAIYPLLGSTISDITTTSCTATSFITVGGLPVTARGVVWHTTTAPTLASNLGKTTNGAGDGEFTSSIASLTPNTRYYVRAYATRSPGTTYGTEVSVTTLPIVDRPVLSTITTTAASLTASVQVGGAASVTVRGICYSTSSNPTIEDSKVEKNSGTGNFSATICGLTPNTLYYVRAYATNTGGTTYSTQISFRTESTVPTTVSDSDGNVYSVIKIGNQLWTVENWKSTKYNDGTAIPNVTDATAWAELTTGAYCGYNNTSNKNIYGLLYNWHAVNTGKMAPTSWRVPTVEDWAFLENYLIANGYNYDGTTDENKIAKSMADVNNPNAQWNPITGIETGAICHKTNYPTYNNKSRFSALAGGYRFYDGIFTSMGNLGYWWSSTQNDATTATGRLLHTGQVNLAIHNELKSFGLSVRLVRDL